MKITLRHVVLFVLVAAVSWYTGTAGADPERLRVGFSQWPPWKITSGNTIDGIDARILNALARHAGIEIEYFKCPWPRCIDMFKKGELDLLTSFGKNTEREIFTHYLLPPYVTDPITFWVKKTSGRRIDSYEDLNGLRIGTTKGSMYFSRFDKDDHLNKVAVGWERQLFMMLDNNRIDAFIGYETSIKYNLVLEKDTNRFHRVAFYHPGSSSHIALSKKSKHAGLHPKLSKALDQLVTAGETHTIIREFLSETTASPSDFQ